MKILRYLVIFALASSMMQIAVADSSKTAWTWKVHRDQIALQKFKPIRHPQYMGTHNSFAWHGGPDKYENHHENISYQLDRGIRMLELDIHDVDDGENEICHYGVGRSCPHVGSGGGVGGGTIFSEIAQWLRANTDQLLYIKLEVKTKNDEISQLFALVSKHLGPYVYMPPKRPNNTPDWNGMNITAHDLLAQGKQVILTWDEIGDYQDDATTWLGRLAFPNFETISADNEAVPASTGTNIYRPSVYNDAEAENDGADDKSWAAHKNLLSDKNGWFTGFDWFDSWDQSDTLGGLDVTASNACTYTGTTIREAVAKWVCAATNNRADPRATDLIFSWKWGFPSSNSNNCVYSGSKYTGSNAEGKLGHGTWANDQSCSTAKRAFCRVRNNNNTASSFEYSQSDEQFHLTSTAVSWSNAQAQCKAEFGAHAQFTVPYQGWEMDELDTLRNNNSSVQVWLNYAKDSKGNWRSGLDRKMQEGYIYGHGTSYKALAVLSTLENSLMGFPTDTNLHPLTSDVAIEWGPKDCTKMSISPNSSSATFSKSTCGNTVTRWACHNPITSQWKVAGNIDTVNTPNQINDNHWVMGERFCPQVFGPDWYFAFPSDSSDVSAISGNVSNSNTEIYINALSEYRMTHGTWGPDTTDYLASTMSYATGRYAKYLIDNSIAYQLAATDQPIIQSLDSGLLTSIWNTQGSGSTDDIGLGHPTSHMHFGSSQITRWEGINYMPHSALSYSTHYSLDWGIAPVQEHASWLATGDGGSFNLTIYKPQTTRTAAWTMDGKATCIGSRAEAWQINYDGRTLDDINNTHRCVYNSQLIRLDGIRAFNDNGSGADRNITFFTPTPVRTNDSVFVQGVSSLDSVYTGWIRAIDSDPYPYFEHPSDIGELSQWNSVDRRMHGFRRYAVIFGAGLPNPYPPNGSSQ